MTPDFQPHLRRWDLVPDGDPIVTLSAHLLPVRRGEARAMLKVPSAEEERRGAALLVWWGGRGAAPVLGEHEGVLLLERAEGPLDLTEMAESGRDDEAARILCEVAAALHVPRADAPRTLVPLKTWFGALAPAARSQGGILTASSKAARELLADPREVTVLHGDLHHGNVLDFGEKGWLAIDPKGLLGERGFDFANLFCNPSERLATDPERLSRLAALISEHAALDRRRLLLWVLAYAGLSAAWTLEDGGTPSLALAVAELARCELRL